VVLAACEFPVPKGGPCDADGACPVGEVCSADNRCEPEAGTCVDELTAGDEHTCVIREDHTAWCWGRNGSGQLGDGTTELRGAPVRVVGDTKFVAIAAGNSHTCALAEDTGVWCWGNNDAGQLGGGLADSKQPVQVAGLTSVTAITSGNAHSCALLGDGSVRCWGEIGPGQFAGGRKVSGATEIAAGGDTTCAVTGDGGVACWDDGDAFTLALPDGIQAAHVAVGREFLCVLSTGGAVYCLGDNQYGQLGLPGPQRFDLVRVPLTVTVTAIFAGAQFACAVTEARDGEGGRNVWCWGADADHELADGVTRNHPSPFLTTYASAVSAAGGTYHMCALSEAGGVTCSGFNGRGQLGDGHPTMQGKPPPAIPGLRGVTSVAAGRGHSCAVADGAVWCWGANDLGQLGDGTVVDRSAPVRVLGVEHATAVVANDEHSCALLEGGTAKCWGSNGVGQLGNGLRPSDSHFPGAAAQPVVDHSGSVLTGITQLAAGADHTCAVAAGIPYCWGANNMFQIGNDVNDGLPVNTPDRVAVPGAPVVEITAGHNHGCALMERGMVMCWGANNEGQLGNADTLHVNQFRPVAVAMLDPPEHIRSYGDHTCAIAGGRAICWGEGDHGEIGSGDLGNHDFPDIPVKMLAAPSLLATGDEHSCAVTADGLSCWGTNDAGQLGDGSFDRRTTPALAAMPTGAKIIAVAGGAQHTCAVLEGGTVTCWGLGDRGQLGDGAFEKLGRVAPQMPCP
ncbi:MAG TPA: hypothetical protein VGD80_15170, partial [Kofleriaceae bacterium]